MVSYLYICMENYENMINYLYTHMENFENMISYLYTHMENYDDMINYLYTHMENFAYLFLMTAFFLKGVHSFLMHEMECNQCNKTTYFCLNNFEFQGLIYSVFLLCLILLHLIIMAIEFINVCVL